MSESPLQEKRWLLFILAAAAFVRLYGLTAFSLSNDELSALARLQFPSFAEMIRQGVYTDYHPAGVEVFLWFWTGWFGNSEWVVRVPFALAGIGSVYLIYRIGRYWFSVPAGLAAAATLALLEFPLLYSQIARPYSPGLFFTLLATWSWTRLIFDRELQPRQLIIRAVLFALSVSACMYIHYFSFIFAGLLCGTGLFFIRRSNLMYYLGSGLLIVILYLPHLQIFFHQLSKGGVGGAEGWLGPPDESTFGKYVMYCFNDSLTMQYIFIAFLAGSLLVFKGRYRFNRFHLLSLVFFLLPFAIAYYYSIYRNPVLQYSVLLFSFPYLVLLLFSALPEKTESYLTRFIVLTLMLVTFYSSFVSGSYYSKQHFTEFRGIANRVRQLDQALGEDQITRAINIHSPYYIHYYLDKIGHPVSFGVYRVNSEVEKDSLSRLITSATTPYFLFAYSNMYDDPLFDLMIRTRFPYVLLRDSMLNSGLRLYAEHPADSSLNAGPYFSYSYGFENNEWPMESECRDSVLPHQGRYSVKLDESREYGPTYTFRLSEKQLKPGSHIDATAFFKTNSLPTGAKLVMSIDRGDSSLVWKGEELSAVVVHPGEWTRIYLTLQIPFELQGNEELKFYCWNEKKELLWMDDVTLSAYGNRP